MSFERNILALAFVVLSVCFQTGNYKICRQILIVISKVYKIRMITYTTGVGCTSGELHGKTNMKVFRESFFSIFREFNVPVLLVFYAFLRH